MTFRELSKGQLFEYHREPGQPHLMIKTGERDAICLVDGATYVMHPNKKVGHLRPTRPGEFAYAPDGEPLIVEKITDDRYLCQYIMQFTTKILTTDQITIVDRETARQQNVREGDIILSRVQQTLKDALRLLKSAKVIIRDTPR